MGSNIGDFQSKKELCPAGHEYDEYASTGKRLCSICRKAARKKYDDNRQRLRVNERIRKQREGK